MNATGKCVHTYAQKYYKNKAEKALAKAKKLEALKQKKNDE